MCRNLAHAFGIHDYGVIIKIKSEFDKYDTDGSQTIDRDEFFKVYQGLAGNGQQISQNRLKSEFINLTNETADPSCVGFEVFAFWYLDVVLEWDVF